MAIANPDFIRLWRDEGLRTSLLSHLDTASICAIRLTSSECCDLSTPTLFARTRLTFTPSSLTRPSRLEALSRVGRHIRHLTFFMPHSPATFLPPLVNPSTGREVNFLYSPHTSGGSVSQRPKYGSPELGDLLTQQYPPIFHAATNVPAFVRAVTYMPNLRHLTISCPDQDPAQRYRRDAVDYALVSLRIAIERAPVDQLEKLSLHHMHSSGLVYLRHMPGFGCTPSAGRRWKQIKKLSITMDSWDFHGSQPGKDHLKMLDDYIRAFSANLEKVSFGWSGRRGPCPLTLFSDPLFAPPKTTKLFAEVTSPMSPLPAAPLRPAMVFPNLKYMQIRNASMSTDQVSDFVLEHRHTVREFDFENVVLINGGEWEDALSPLARASSSDEWLSQHSGSETGSSTCFQSQDYLDQLLEFDEVIDTAGCIPSEITRTSVSVKKRRVHRRRRRKHKHKESSEKLVISNPIPITKPIEEALMPTTILMPTTFDPNVRGVQRNVQMEAAQQELADDPDKRVSALKKAREAVLKQLGREYCRRQDRKEHIKGLFQNTCSAGRKGRALMSHESGTALVPLMFSRC